VQHDGGREDCRGARGTRGEPRILHRDLSQVHWEGAPDWQKESALKGIDGVLAGNGPRESHESWLAEKRATGWIWGPVKDSQKKEHPCFVPYDQLPPAQQVKDRLFVHTAREVLTALGVMS
jgi:hypothetical protein